MKERATKEGKRFKELRHLTGLSQAQFAREVGVKVQNISRIEQGYTSIRNMTHERIDMLAEGFNVKPEHLIQYIIGEITEKRSLQPINLKGENKMDARKAHEFAKKYLEVEVKKAKARVEKARVSGVNLDTQEAILELRETQLEEVNYYLDNNILEADI